MPKVLNTALLRQLAVARLFHIEIPKDLHGFDGIEVLSYLIFQLILKIRILLTIEMPRVDSTIESISSTGSRGTITVRDLGIEVGTANRALYYDTTANTLLLVDLFTP